MLEGMGRFSLLQNKYSKSLSRAESMTNLFSVLGGIFKFSAQVSVLEYLFWRCKNPPVSSDLESLLRAYFPNKYTVLGIWNM